MSGSLAFLDMLGGPEILLILVVVLIFFGGEKMPGFARGLGKAIRELKKAASDVENEFKRVIDESDKKPPLAPPRIAPVPRPPEIQVALPLAVPPEAPPTTVTPATPPPPTPPLGDHYDDSVE